MSPNSSVNNHGGGRWGDPELISQLRERDDAASINCSNLSDLVVRKMSVPSGCSSLRIFGSALPLSSFLDHILHVVSISSKKQVIGAYTSSIVTVMTDKHPFWNGTSSQLIGNAMSWSQVSLKQNLPVVIFVMPVAYPQPASIGVTFVNFAPKSFFRRRESAGPHFIVAFPGAKFPSPSLLFGKSGLEYCPAVLTVYLYSLGLIAAFSGAEGLFASPMAGVGLKLLPTELAGKGNHLIPSSFAILLIANSRIAVLVTPSLLARTVIRLAASLLILMLVCFFIVRISIPLLGVCCKRG